MISSKQRAWLRSQANPLDSQFQIGKGEVTATLGPRVSTKSSAPMSS